jgi:hypothetical protein
MMTWRFVLLLVSSLMSLSICESEGLAQDVMLSPIDGMSPLPGFTPDAQPMLQPISLFSTLFRTMR